MWWTVVYYNMLVGVVGGTECHGHVSKPFLVNCTFFKLEENRGCSCCFLVNWIIPVPSVIGLIDSVGSKCGFSKLCFKALSS